LFVIYINNVCVECCNLVEKQKWHIKYIYIYINQPLAHPNALSRALDGPGVARPRTQPQKRHTRVLSTRRDASRDPFALKRCVLETCGTSKLLAGDQPLVHQNPSY